MKYTREILIDSREQPTGYIFFWKPTPGVIGPGCLGQWQPTPFVVDGDHYGCTEQYMMAGKARLFGDAEILDQILGTDDPKQMKALGRKVRNFDALTWDDAKYSLVVDGNRAKFGQNPELAAYLVSTAPKVLVEASPMDTIWGIGFGKDNPRASDPRAWRGRNLLGFALMEVRDELV